MKKVISALVAIGVAALCANAICFGYYWTPATLPRTDAATNWVYVPDSFYFTATEGYGWGSIDKNGYKNLDFNFDSPYLLWMGDSHAEGGQVPEQYRGYRVLSECFENSKFVYSIARGGHTFQETLKRFPAAIEEFPDSEAVVIVIKATDFSSDSLRDASEQIHFKETSAGEYIKENRSFFEMAKTMMKGAFPILAVARLNFSKNTGVFDGAFGIVPSSDDEEPKSWDELQYREAIYAGLALIREEYERPLVIAYHPETKLMRNGSMQIVRDDKSYQIFAQACADNGIIFLDTGDAFLQAYEEDFSVPYGFSNTAMGEGHLNKTGHRILGEQLYSMLKELVSL